MGAKEVYVEAQKGDAVAKKVVKNVGHYLGLGLANLVNIFNPEMVILSGGMSQETCLMVSMKKSFQANVLGLSGKSVKIVKSRFLNDMGILGAAAWSMDCLGEF